MIFIELIYNLGILISISIVSGFLSERWRNRIFLQASQGVLFGFAALIGMMKPLVLAQGLIFDGRSVMISLAGLFFGPVAAIISGIMSIFLRLHIGGDGALAGCLVILSSALIGSVFYYTIKVKENLTIVQLWAFGLLVNIAMLLFMFTMPDNKGIMVLQNITIPTILAYPVTTILIGKILSELNNRLILKANLRESEERNRALTNANPDMMFIFDQNGYFIDYNGNTNQPVTAPDYFIGKNVRDVLNVEISDLTLDKLNTLFKTGQMQVYEYQLAADNQVNYFESRLVLSGSSQALAIVRNITLNKEAENKIKNINIELEAKVYERTANLQIANQELESFSYSVSHDLRAPLRAIEGFSAALFEDYYAKIDQTGQDYLQRIRKAANHMSQLIDDFLNLSRITRQELKSQRLDLSKIVQKTAATLQKSDLTKNVELIIEAGLETEGDINLLTILVSQLMGNAFKFTRKREKAIIRFGLAEKNGNTWFYIKDNGAGFDSAYVDKLFKPFQRLHSTTDFSGTGIGLAIAQRIVNKHGGEIFAESEVDKGACFYFRI